MLTLPPGDQQTERISHPQRPSGSGRRKVCFRTKLHKWWNNPLGPVPASISLAQFPPTAHLPADQHHELQITTKPTMLSNYKRNLFLYLTEVPDNTIDRPTSHPSRPLSQQQGESVKSATPLQKHSPPIKVTSQDPKGKTTLKHCKRLKRISPSQHCQDQVVPGDAN